MRHSRVRSVDCEPGTRGRSRPASEGALPLEFFRQRARLACAFLVFLPATLAAATEPSGTHSVSISRPFFNPTLGQKLRISFYVRRSGSLTLSILDRDGFLVRKLVSGKRAQKGKLSCDWDGRDDGREVVPNDAYSFKIDLKTEGKIVSYFPASRKTEELAVQVKSYDRQNGILAYTMPKAGRVHLQAGTSRPDPRTKKPVGPSLKTIVDREPRPAGSVIEHWNGFDESGLLYVPDLPNFSMSLVATALPENSVITIGSRARSFLEYASRRQGRSLVTAALTDRGHHRGLTAIEDVTPALRLRPENVTWSEAEKLWVAERDELKLTVFLEGPSADAFARQPGGVVVFLNDDPIQELPPGSPPLNFVVSIAQLPPGVHRITTNWISDLGSVAVNSLRIRVENAYSLRKARKGR